MLPKHNKRKRTLIKSAIFVSLLLCLFACTSCSNSSDNYEVAHYVEDSYKFTIFYDALSDTTKISISMDFENESDSTVKQTIITVKYFSLEEEKGIISAMSENGMSFLSVLDEIEKGETKTLFFFVTVLGQADNVQRVSEVFKYDSIESDGIDKTLLGVIIGSAAGIIGGIIGAIVSGFITRWLEKIRNENAKSIEKLKDDTVNTNLRKQEKGKVYLKLYKLYYYYVHDYDAEGQKMSDSLNASEREKKHGHLMDKIIEISLELGVCGSIAMKELVEKINLDSPTLSTDIDNFRIAIRTEMGVSDANN